ncbi:MAG: efflux RND transporter periplasmic adaptor subunit [Chloroflexia bacterium]|nr:efflux RND transporter periplasmic adaptor subunit [Chloroflexia bacterium]
MKTFLRQKWVRSTLLALLALAAVAAVLAWRWWQQNERPPAENRLRASGSIEVEEIEVASELGGRVTALYVDEGDVVQAGEPLVQLDDALAQIQLEQAQALLAEAQAAVARAESGAAPLEIAQARAVLSQTLAARDGALLVWEAAEALVEDPQEVLAQYHSAQGTQQAAAANVVSVEQLGGTVKESSRLLWYNAANTLRDAQAAYSLIYWQNRQAERERDLTQAEIEAENAAWRRVEDAERGMQIGELSYSLSQVLESQNNAVAQANLQTAQKITADLGWMFSEPLSIEAQAAQAEAAYLQAEAAVLVAQAGLERLQAGLSEEELAMLQSKLRQAEAAVAAAELQLERSTLYAPVSGIALARSIHPGELAAPGYTLLTLGDLDTVRLTLYIPENRYGQVHLGQQVQIQVDSYPDEAFWGEITYISPQSEFTPKDVQTQEERIHLVYAVRVRVPNSEHKLKPGMPADAEILLEP